MSSLTIDGMSRISCPLEIFWIVVVESLVIISKSKSNSKKQSKVMECCLDGSAGVPERPVDEIDVTCKQGSITRCRPTKP